MVATNLDRYHDVRNRFGVKVGSWATSIKPEAAGCRNCLNTCIALKQLIAHSESSKHRKNTELKISARNQQPTIMEALDAGRNEEKR